MATSSVSLLTAIVVGIAVFGLGYGWNAMRVARALLKGTKDGVPKARTAYRASLGRVVKWFLVTAAILFVLITWSTRDAPAAPTKPSPSPASPQVRR